MIDLYLFRHAESEMNDAGAHLVGGRSNSTKLTKNGENQAKSLGIRLAGEKINFDYIYCSPAVRTQETAKIALAELKGSANPVTADCLQELSQGEWEGKKREECYNPATMKVLNELGWNFKAPGGESRKEVEERMLGFVEKEVLSKYKEGQNIKIAVFSHGMAIKCLLRGILDFDQTMTFKTIIDNTSISQLRFEERGWFVERINDGAHVTDSDTLKAYFNFVYGEN